MIEELSRKHPVFPVSLVKPYTTRPETVEKKTSPIPMAETPSLDQLKFHKILKDKKGRIHWKDVRLYLVRYKNQSAHKDEFLPEINIPDGPIHLRNSRASRRKP